jgi:hypothetical protein
MTCQAILPGRGGAAGIVRASGGSSVGYGPGDLQSAYGLTAASAHRGAGETVAIVDAYNNPDLASNLATYRRDFRLPACGTKTGCLRIVNENGRASRLPAANSGWGTEESLDLDMVSAICPRCHILLVEASVPDIQDLGTAELTAVRMGARFVSNSWSGGEFPGQDAYNSYFNHPGDAIVFASGDFGYGPEYPADTQFVTSVGGTTLVRTKFGSRRWSESVWGGEFAPDGTGSGCSALEAKPSWQTSDNSAARGCLNRTENDVAAVADPNTGVAILDTYKTGVRSLFDIGGTSAATPIITATYALAGKPVRGSYAAEYPYLHHRDFHAVAAGTNGKCEASRQYLCRGERGYNGPAGVGTPAGTAGLSSRGVPGVTVLDPGTQDFGDGASVRITVRAVDTDAAARALSYSAAGLPAGLKIGSAPHSLDGVITGTLPGSAGTYHVTVRARDSRTGQGATTRFALYAIGSLNSSAEPGPAPISVVSSHGTGCLSAASATAGTAVVMDPCNDSSVAQGWEVTSGATPGSPDAVTVAPGICLGLSPTHAAVLQACNGSADQQWQYVPTTTIKSVPLTWLVNPAAGLCLNGQNVTTAGQQVLASPCDPAYTSYGENWTMNVGLLLMSGRAGDCANEGIVFGIYAFAEACNAGQTQEQWTVGGGELSSHDNDCLVENGLLDGSLATYASCGVVAGFTNGFWLPGPGGELINANSGRCLDNQGRGLKLIQEDCYGQPGEIWAFN